jgi:hypothetical protein
MAGDQDSWGRGLVFMEEDLFSWMQVIFQADGTIFYEKMSDNYSGFSGLSNLSNCILYLYSLSYYRIITLSH